MKKVYLLWQVVDAEPDDFVGCYSSQKSLQERIEQIKKVYQAFDLPAPNFRMKKVIIDD